MFEQVKDYKSACAILGKKPIDKRRKLDEHIVLHIMLSTITEAINFIANGNKPWIPVYQQTNQSKHGTIGGILIGIKLKKVLMQVYSIWILTLALVLPMLMSVIIYNSLTEMQQNTQLKHLNHCI